MTRWSLRSDYFEELDYKQGIEVIELRREKCIEQNGDNIEK